MSWERWRHNHLKEKMCVTVGRRGLRKGRPGIETIVNRLYCLPHSKTFVPHIPLLVQTDICIIFREVLESSFHVPFSYPYNGSPMNPRNKSNLHKLPEASAWMPLYLPALNLPECWRVRSSLLLVRPWNTIIRKCFWTANSMTDLEITEHNINIIRKYKMHNLYMQDRYQLNIILLSSGCFIGINYMMSAKAVWEPPGKVLYKYKVWLFLGASTADIQHCMKEWKIISMFPVVVTTSA